MDKGHIQIFCGEGRGKTSAAVGQGIKAAERGKSVVIIQFLKGNTSGGFDILKRLEPDIKLFSFEKSESPYEELSDEERIEEAGNIRNGVNFAKKVLTTGGCDLLILDEFLGLFDNDILTIEDFKDLIEAKGENVGIIMTGINVREDICKYAGEITKLETVKFLKGESDVSI
ncbi:MAG: cob(I)yrinic acid a,c-diamide adenosyltransferase [Lachnospiraceae bacterium]|nr:cob(I)yrinic acid a,c-diamide adenosyltransferase [Lachnospiraceae bacterium]MDN4742198.1 cob(I)yrinic acid a,c-diamide adenosyltransferase [Lachnospiraceae bacterium C1.1]